MMKTLVVTNDLPPRNGGIETFIHEVLIRQPKGSIVALGPANDDAAAFDPTSPYPIVRHDGAVLPTPAMARKAVAIAREHGCDQVLIASAMPVGLMTPTLNKAGLPVAVVITHGNEAGWAGVPGVGRALRRISDARFVTYLGAYTRSRIEPVLKPGTVMRRLAPAVDAQRFSPDVDASAIRARHVLAGRPVIGCISRLVARKGQDRLIEAMPRILQFEPDAALLLVGDGPAREDLEKLARSTGVLDHVIFAGRASDEDLPAYYAACDVFALPCRTQRRGIDVEGLGIVFLEASASGKPVVAGDSGGAPDAVLNGHTGVVVADDVRQLADALIDLLNDETRAQAMGAAGRSWVLESWTWETPAARLRSMLEGRDPGE